MKKNLFKSIIVGIVLIFIIAVAVYLKQPTKPVLSSQKEVVKIGVILPLTGNLAYIGQNVKGAMEIAINDANKNPKHKYLYEGIFEDGAYSPAKTASSLKKLAFIDHVDALITTGSSTAYVVTPTATKEGIVHIALSNDRQNADGKYNFIYWLQPETYAQKITEVVKQKGYKNIQIVSTVSTGMLFFSDRMADNFKKEGINYFVSQIQPKTSSMQLDIAKMRQNKPDLYIINMQPPEIFVFMKQLREEGDKTEMTSLDFSHVQNLSDINGSWFVGPSEPVNEITDRIKAYNKSDNAYLLASQYDQVLLLVQAFEAATNKKQVSEALQKIKEYDGIGGRTIQEKGGVFDLEAVVKHVQDGKIVEVKE